MTAKIKNPTFAQYLAIIPGFGHFYVGQWIKGTILLILIPSTVIFLVGLFIWVWSFNDAKTQAELYNQRALLRTIEKAGK